MRKFPPLMNVVRSLLALFFLCPAALFAQSANKTEAGTVRGKVVDASTHQPVEYATVTLKRNSDHQAVKSAATDKQGIFTFEEVPFGDYTLSYGPIGSETQETASFALDAKKRVREVGELGIGDGTIKMEKLNVTTRAETFYNSIDRKVYSVGKDIQSANGTASDLMQNIPSVQVDIDGNVSLRGSTSVLMLIDGKPSTLMGANRSAVLEQMPADTIERIEVITNPSAKYKPDGTAGIINIVLKKKHTPGYSGVLRGGVGTSRRFNGSVSGNYNPGKYNLYGSYSMRQDDRVRTATDNRSHLDEGTNTWLGTKQFTVERSRPLSHIAQGGIDYKVDDENKVGAVARFNYRSFTRYATETDQSFDAAGVLTKDYDRRRIDPEFEEDIEVKTTFEHSFAKEGEELNVELQASNHKEQEDNHYSDVFRTPTMATSYDNKRITQKEAATQVQVEYVRPMENDAKLESGYSREENKLDGIHFGDFFDAATGAWLIDTAATNRFIYDSTIHSLYGTFGRPWNKFGFLSGLRLEETYIDTNQVTTNTRNKNDYFRVYPTLHLNYNLTETSQLQLNYSRRVHRPEGDDLNPYPEFQDPFNLRAGNPKLLPEDIHSVEAGYQYRKDSTNYLAGVYYRHLTHGMTQVTRYINSTTLLTTKENLSSNDSAGVELSATTDLGPKVSINFSSNIYYSQIDAGNLGFAAKRSAVAWDAKLNVNYRVSKATLVQFNSNFTAKRLTPQGYRYPTYVANLGFKHEFKDKKTAFVFTISDIFDSLKERTLVDTPILHDETTRRRTSRIVYAGFIYNLGKTSKKAKDDALPFDSGP